MTVPTPEQIDRIDGLAGLFEAATRVWGRVYGSEPPWACETCEAAGPPAADSLTAAAGHFRATGHPIGLGDTDHAFVRLSTGYDAFRGDDD